METVKTQDISTNDLNWKIEYDMDRCTMCGSCLATCTFQAIKADVIRIDKTTSDGLFPDPKHTHKAIPVIKQVKTLANACVGCGMCEKVCPNGAIRPVRNADTRKTLLSRDHGPIKRGGRTNLNAQRTLDSIIVGRISQMTDPALDSQRHTFDIRSPFGRVLPAKDLPLKMENGKLVMEHKAPPVNWIYPLIFSDMSIGALSTRAWEAVALACAYLNEKCNIPIRMSSGEGGMPIKLLESDYLKYMILQIASGHFGWNRIVKALPKMKVDPAGVLKRDGLYAFDDFSYVDAMLFAKRISILKGFPTIFSKTCLNFRHSSFLTFKFCHVSLPPFLMIPIILHAGRYIWRRLHNGRRCQCSYHTPSWDLHRGGYPPAFCLHGQIYSRSLRCWRPAPRTGYSPRSFPCNERLFQQ